MRESLTLGDNRRRGVHPMTFTQGAINDVFRTVTGEAFRSGTRFPEGRTMERDLNTYRETVLM